jgi:hypothetical protein
VLGAAGMAHLRVGSGGLGGPQQQGRQGGLRVTASVAQDVLWRGPAGAHPVLSGCSSLGLAHPGQQMQATMGQAGLRATAPMQRTAPCSPAVGQASARHARGAGSGQHGRVPGLPARVATHARGVAQARPCAPSPAERRGQAGAPSAWVLRPLPRGSAASVLQLCCRCSICVHQAANDLGGGGAVGRARQRLPAGSGRQRAALGVRSAQPGRGWWFGAGRAVWWRVQEEVAIAEGGATAAR